MNGKNFIPTPNTIMVCSGVSQGFATPEGGGMCAGVSGYPPGYRAPGAKTPGQEDANLAALRERVMAVSLAERQSAQSASVGTPCVGKSAGAVPLTPAAEGGEGGAELSRAIHVELFPGGDDEERAPSTPNTAAPGAPRKGPRPEGPEGDAVDGAARRLHFPLPGLEENLARWWADPAISAVVKSEDGLGNTEVALTYTNGNVVKILFKEDGSRRCYMCLSTGEMIPVDCVPGRATAPPRPGSYRYAAFSGSYTGATMEVLAAAINSRKLENPASGRSSPGSPGSLNPLDWMQEEDEDDAHLARFTVPVSYTPPAFAEEDDDDDDYTSVGDLMTVDLNSEADEPGDANDGEGDEPEDGFDEAFAENYVFSHLTPEGLPVYIQVGEDLFGGEYEGEYNEEFDESDGEDSVS